MKRIWIRHLEKGTDKLLVTKFCSVHRELTKKKIRLIKMVKQMVCCGTQKNLFPFVHSACLIFNAKHRSMRVSEKKWQKNFSPPKKSVGNQILRCEEKWKIRFLVKNLRGFQIVYSGRKGRWSLHLKLTTKCVLFLYFSVIYASLLFVFSTLKSVVLT